MQYLTPRDMEIWRTKIARLCNIPSSGIIIQQRGRFEMYQLNDSDAHRILSILRRDDSFCDLSLIPGTYDFSHMSTNLLPSRKYSLTGKIKLD